MFTFATFSFNLQSLDKRENTNYIKSLLWLSVVLLHLKYKRISFRLGLFCIYKKAPYPMETNTFVQTLETPTEATGSPSEGTDPS